MTSVSKNVYIDKLANIVNEYNNTYNGTIKSLLMSKIIPISDLVNKLIKKIPSLKLLIMQEYQNTKTVLLKFILQIGKRKLL